MFRLRTTLVVSAFALLIATAGYANTILVANLTNSQENPPTNPTLSTGGARPASFGTATFDLNNAMTAMTFTATIFNIDITRLADGRRKRQPRRRTYSRRSLGDSDHEWTCRLGILRCAF